MYVTMLIGNVTGPVPVLVGVDPEAIVGCTGRDKYIYTS